MATVGARELKNRLGTYLRRVREGETILVTDRGRPVAELRPLAATESDEETLLEELAARGLLAARRRAELVADFEPVVVSGKPLSETVVEDRGDRS